MKKLTDKEKARRYDEMLKEVPQYKSLSDMFFKWHGEWLDNELRKSPEEPIIEVSDEIGVYYWGNYNEWYLGNGKQVIGYNEHVCYIVRREDNFSCDKIPCKLTPCKFEDVPLGRVVYREHLFGVYSNIEYYYIKIDNNACLCWEPYGDIYMPVHYSFEDNDDVHLVEPR